MSDVPDQPLPTVRPPQPPLAVASLVLGVLAFALPYAVLIGVGLLFEPSLIFSFGRLAGSLIAAAPALVCWLLGPLALLLGVVAVRAGRSRSASTPTAAVVGVVLGALSVPCVLLPLLGYMLFVVACAQGC